MARNFILRVYRWISVSLLITPLAWGGTIEGNISNPKSKDLSNFIVSIEDIEATHQSPIQPAEMNQSGLRFVPHVLAVVAGTTVEFPNNDLVLHNVFSISKAKRFNLGLYGRGIKRSIQFDQPGVVELLCSVHLEMSGFIVVLKNRFFAQTGADGHFRIAGVPAGYHRVRCWHEQLAIQEQQIKVPADGEVNLDFDMGE